uniref:signal-regulatory protein beta-2-like n=1 Tax=Semicossyphus pulcher TaxID=241346 RepID=UPI0037E795E2
MECQPLATLQIHPLFLDEQLDGCQLQGCTNDQTFETKTVGAGDNVKLTCPRDTSWIKTQLFWIRLVSGALPEVLGGTFNFDSNKVNKSPRITAKQEPGTFVLIISKTQLSDSGLYFCVKQTTLKMTLLKGTFLTVKGRAPDITPVIQDLSSDPVRPGDSVTLQCSLLSDSDYKTCPGKHSVFWFRSGSDESHPSVIYTLGNRTDECENSPEARSPQKCVYSFSKTVSSSDAGTYYCAVATCGEILFGKGTKLDIEGKRRTHTWPEKKDSSDQATFFHCSVIQF